MTNYENILVESNEAVARITINRPKVLNALNNETMAELGEAFAALEKDGKTRVAVITGAGEKSFVAGADISQMAALSATDAAHFARLGHKTLARMEASDIVVIAQVNGYALGGGCELMLACDFAIASDNARFGQPEVGLGVIPGFGGTVRLSRRIGAARARQLLVTGEQLKADAAAAIGLVNEVVPADQLASRVDALAAKIVKNAPLAVAWAKRSARLAEEAEISTANRYEQELFGMCFATEDQKEGMQAFLDKRAAAWKGR